MEGRAGMPSKSAGPCCPASSTATPTSPSMAGEPTSSRPGWPARPTGTCTGVREVCEVLIPTAAVEGLAEAVDVYVEDIAFTVQDLERVAAAARAHGMAVRCHADQLGPSGAAEAAVAVGARSADHLNHVSAEGVRALGGSKMAAVVLPVSTLFLRADPPPVAELISSGAAVALATDFNPGTSPCLSIPEAISV